MRYIESIREAVKGKAVCIAPMGIGGKTMYDDLSSMGIFADYFYDNNSNMWGQKYKRAVCLSKTQLETMDKNDVVLIIETSEYYWDIRRQMKSYGFQYFFRVFFGKIAAEDYIDSYKDTFEQKVKAVLNVCEDKKSQKVVKHITNFWGMANVPEDYFEPIRDNGIYFDHTLFSLSENESFVDAGAYVGDTFRLFKKATGGKFQQVYMFELDSVIYKQLCKNVQANGQDICCFSEGLSDNEEDVFFKPGNGNSSLVRENGLEKGKVTTLDARLQNQKITFIKMDIEGSELRALRGGQRNNIDRKAETCYLCIP